MRGRITALAVGSLLATAGTTGTAYAAPGLTVDPQSPAGVEYAVPLDSGREHGHPGRGSGGGTSGGAGASDSPTLFGSGITPTANGKAGAPDGKSRAGSGAKTPGGRQHGGSPPPVVAPVSASARYSTSGPIAGVIAAILLGGGGLGLFLRLRGRRATGL